MRIALPWDDQPRLTAAQFVVLGEVHGTAEAPAFISALVDARTATRPLSIGLEMAASEQETIDRFLASDGGPRARAELLRGPHWHGLRDGRSSLAMLDLLESLRRRRAEGVDVDVVVFDDQTAQGNDREHSMAHNLHRALLRRDHAQVIVLVGNLHARRTAGVPWDDHYTPMAMLLAASFEVITLDMACAPGVAWNCRPGPPMRCGAHPLHGLDRGRAPFVELEDRARDEEHPFDGIYYVGVPTASRPAVPER